MGELLSGSPFAALLSHRRISGPHQVPTSVVVRSRRCAGSIRRGVRSGSGRSNRRALGGGVEYAHRLGHVWVLKSLRLDIAEEYARPLIVVLQADEAR